MPRMHLAAVLVGGALLYALLGWGSLRLAMTQANASAVWPLAGLGIGMLSRFGIRYWPTILAGAMLTNFVVNHQNGAPFSAALLAAIGIAIGNTAEAVVGARLSRHALGKPPQLATVDGVFRFVLFAGVIPPLLSASCGVFSLQATGLLPAAIADEVRLVWFTGNVAGILTFAPLFFIDSFRISSGWWTRRRLAECLAILIGLVFVGQAIGGMYFAEKLTEWPKTYMAIPLVLWISCRFGRRGAMAAVLLLMILGVIGTLRGYAAFPSASPEQSLLSLQLFISVLAVIGLTVSVLVYQLRLKRQALAAALMDQSLRLAAVTRENEILTASAIHDLQSPLSGMRNLLQLVRKSPEVFAEPEGDRLISEMQDAVERMFVLVTEALSAARPQAGPATHANAEPCDLTALLHHLIEAEQSHAEAKAIKLHRSMPAEPVIIATRSHILQPIIGNFLSNAVKFSKPGTRVFIDLENTAAEIIISITDEGPGMTERDCTTIFSGNLRAHVARPTDGESSTGMGLYLAAQLAPLIGAKLTCDPTANGGTTFAVRIQQPE